MKSMLRICIACVFALSRTANAGIEETEPITLFKNLRNRPQNREEYYDMHGNACRSLLALMIGRFKFTTNVCVELDSIFPKPMPAYTAALYDGLGEVKDPASIPWLESRLGGVRRSEVYSDWLPQWYTYLRGADPESERWLEKPERWAVFFQKWAESETTPALRTRVLYAMQGWCHTQQTLNFFVRLEHDPQTQGEDLLIAELYLQQHGRTFDTNRLRECIGPLQKSADGQKVLLKFAEQLRSEIFVPWLLTVVEQDLHADFYDVPGVLKKITFQQDISDAYGWKSWGVRHDMESRRQRVTETSNGILELAKTNLPTAKERLDQAMHYWDDPALLPVMERLVDFKPLHSQIVGWINLTYGDHHHVPGLRDKLRALALKIRSEGDGHLEPWARRLMREWDFLYEDRKTWEQFITQKNMAV